MSYSRPGHLHVGSLNLQCESCPQIIRAAFKNVLQTCLSESCCKTISDEAVRFRGYVLDVIVHEFISLKGTTTAPNAALVSLGDTNVFRLLVQMSFLYLIWKLHVHCSRPIWTKFCVCSVI